jgi:ectoine hydroxylase-related dioxygenase (phytanoyl-CoA dioxygenase family)
MVSDLNIEELKLIYEEKGIVRVPSVFTEEECIKIKENAYAVTDVEIKNAGYKLGPSEQIYNKKSLVFFPAIANKYLNQIRTSDKMVNLVREFIGDDVRQINNQIYFREPGDLDEFAWHQDLIFRESEIFSNDVEEDYFQTIIAVDNITLENGAIEFIEGSHKGEVISKPINLRKFDRNGLKGVKYTAKRGDVLIWSVRIVHGSERNLSDQQRMTYMNGFCRTKAASSYPHYLINGSVIENMDSKLLPCTPR